MLQYSSVVCPRWAIMWLMATTIYFACKRLTLIGSKSEWARSWRLWAYVLAWPGMDPLRFFATRRLRLSERPDVSEWVASALKTITGAMIFWNAQHLTLPESPLLLGWAGMTGTIMMLHFGSFQLLSCLWRSVGVDAPPLMNRPLRSTSIAEFWGRRWNTAFRDLTYRFIFRPLRVHLGPILALVLGFVLSGLIHDLVISLPAGGGYGGPTCFFCIQAGGVLVERTSVAKSLGLGRGWRGRLFTGLVLLLPLRLLFHDAFLTRIVVSFMEALGAA